MEHLDSMDLSNKPLILKEEIYGNCPVCKTLLCWPTSWKADPAHWASKPEIVYCPICLKNVDLKERDKEREAEIMFELWGYKK